MKSRMSLSRLVSLDAIESVLGLICTKHTNHLLQSAMIFAIAYYTNGLLCWSSGLSQLMVVVDGGSFNRQKLSVERQTRLSSKLAVS